MKKHLIAVAVVAAFSAPAIAQNVSLSGYLEAGLENTKNSSSGTADTTAFVTGVFGSSRFVIGGSEDLGGGLKAGFRLESSVDITSGRFGHTTLGTQANNPIFDRGAELNLSGAFGTIAYGKLDHNGIENNEAAQSAIVGNISLATSSNTAYGANVEASAVASDANGTLRYVTPAFNGIQLDLGWTPSDNGTAALASGATAHEGIRSAQIRGTLADISFRLGGGRVSQSTGDTDVRGVSIGYNFGVAEASVFYQNQDNPGATNDVKETILAAKIPLGNGLDIRGNYRMIDVAGGTTSDATQQVIAVAKALSKRTTVYGMFRNTDLELSGGNDTKELGVYVAHTF